MATTRDLRMNEQLQALDRARGTAIDLAVAYGPRLLAAVLILAAGVHVGRWVARWIEPALAKFELEPSVLHLITRLVWLFVVGLFGMVALQNLGVELLPLIAGLGIAGAGVALALQGVLGNLAAGLTIIFTRPFRVGEYISIVGVEGQIESIGLFSTTLTHLDRSKVVVPNRKIVGEILHNHGKTRQLHLNVNVDYRADLTRVVAVIRELLQANPRVLKEPAPVVDVALLGEFAIAIQVQPWVAAADHQAASSEIQQGIVEAFRRSGIAIPLRELHLAAPAP
jgi:small conductance mechanosensitive channel